MRTGPREEEEEEEEEEACLVIKKLCTYCERRFKNTILILCAFN
jgi:hypothetical protein